MKMEHHIMATAPVAAGAWFFTHNWFYVVMSLCLGVLVDFDHVFDYIREEGRFDMKGLFLKSYKGDFYRLYVIFHAWEYIPIAWLAGYIMKNYTFSVVFSAAYLVHMIPDQLMNNVKPWGYFLTYRIMKKFAMTEIFYKGRPIKNQEPKSTI